MIFMSSEHVNWHKVTFHKVSFSIFPEILPNLYFAEVFQQILFVVTVFSRVYAAESDVCSGHWHGL